MIGRHLSARAISWTWKRMVIRFSKISVTTGPMHPAQLLGRDDLGPEFVPLPS